MLAKSDPGAVSRLHTVVVSEMISKAPLQLNRAYVVLVLVEASVAVPRRDSEAENSLVNRALASPQRKIEKRKATKYLSAYRRPPRLMPIHPLPLRI